jgi:hypothetical protein
MTTQPNHPEWAFNGDLLAHGGSGDGVGAKRDNSVPFEYIL